MSTVRRDGFANLYVERAQIRNFRGLNCDLDLEPGLTLLVGRNNVGKSRILRALAIALGGTRADVDDLTVGADTPATVDVFIAPCPTQVQVEGDSADDRESEEFEPRLREIFARGLQQTSLVPSRQRFAWRTTVQRSLEGVGARAARHVLSFTDSPDGGTWSLRDMPTTLTTRQAQVVAAVPVSDQRDIDQELRRPGSAIRRILSDLDIDEDLRSRLERDLADLGRRIINGSATLADMRDALTMLASRIGGIGEPTLNPVPSRIEELARSVVVEMNTGSGSLPARLHGSGTKSLASLQLQGVLYEHRLGKDMDPPQPHPVTLIEEPEAHLYPQAILELPGLMGALRGQMVASTHSASLVSASDPSSIRILRSEGITTRIVDLRPAEPGTETEDTPRGRRPGLYVEEMEKLKRQVERPFGELLFASAIVIGDGATERAFLPVMIRHALGVKADGITIVDPESLRGPLARAVVKFACLVDIPWFLFADSDSDGDAAANELINTYADGEADRIIWIKGRGAPATEKMLMIWDDALCREVCLGIRGDRANEDTLELLKATKGSAGSSLGYAFIRRYPDRADWPQPLDQLIQRLEAAISLQ